MIKKAIDLNDNIVQIGSKEEVRRVKNQYPKKGMNNLVKYFENKKNCYIIIINYLIIIHFI